MQAQSTGARMRPRARAGLYFTSALTSERCMQRGQLHPITGRKLSPVEIERAERLHRKFLSVDKSRAAGRTLETVLRHYAWYWRNRTYHCDHTRKVRFGYGTLVMLYYKWIKADRCKECLYRRWRSVSPRIVSKAFLLEFVKFCAEPRTLSLLAAWKEFIASRETLPPVTYSTILRYFNSRPYRQIQRALRTGKPIKGFLATARQAIRAQFVSIGGRKP